MPTHVLRNSIGPWSGGTAVDIITDNHDGTVTVEIPHVKPDASKGINYEDLLFDIEKRYIVELRKRTEPIPNNGKGNRRERRAGMRKAEQLVDSLLNADKGTTNESS